MPKIVNDRRLKTESVWGGVVSFSKETGKALNVWGGPHGPQGFVLWVIEDTKHSGKEGETLVGKPRRPRESTITTTEGGGRERERKPPERERSKIKKRWGKELTLADEALKKN